METKIFVVGASGSGKTTFAKQYSVEQSIQYIDRDLLYGQFSDNFKQLDIGSYLFLNSLPKSFICDGTVHNKELFKKYVEQNNPQFIYTFCSDKNILIKRVLEKENKGCYHIPKDAILNEYIIHCIKYSLNKLQEISNDRILYYDTCTNEYKDKKEAVIYIQ